MQKRWTVLLLALAACACGQMKEPGHAVDQAAVEAYHEADRALLARARQGVRMSMTHVGMDGKVVEGFNEVISGTPNRMREVRPAYEAVCVGATICTQYTNGDDPACEEGEWEPGLRALDVARIRRAKASVVPCGEATCRRIRIEQANTPWSETEKLLEGKQASAEEGRLVVVLLIREDGLPYSQSEWQWIGADRVEGEATYTFDYNTPVAPIELPAERQG